jgi:uncharacterized alkaline shock family protein YloU
MTEVTTGVPLQRSSYDMDQTDVSLTAIPAYTDVEPAATTSPVHAVPVAEPVGFRERLDDAGDRVTAFAGDTAERAGDYAHAAAAATTRFAGDVATRIRNSADLQNERGTTTIADEVVEKISGFAAREVEGIYDLGGDMARVFASVKERIGLGDADEDSDRGVSVRLEGKNANIKIVIVIEYGYIVYTVCEQVRTKVIAAVESMLGLEVTAVDIVVDDIHIDDSKFAATAKK